MVRAALPAGRMKDQMGRKALDRGCHYGQAAGVEGAWTGRRPRLLHPAPPPALTTLAIAHCSPKLRHCIAKTLAQGRRSPILLVNCDSALKPRLKCHLLREALSAGCST